MEIGPYLLKFTKSLKKNILTIEDTGIGIPKHDVDRVFNPFFLLEKMVESTRNLQVWDFTLLRR